MPLKQTLSYAVDPVTHCWNWTKGVSGTGYGIAWFEGKLLSAHRLSYTLHKGQIPDKFDIDHLCRNKRCINPDHLEAVSHAENNRRGSSTKLNEMQVRRIKFSLRNGLFTQAMLARFYGVSDRTIRDIKTGVSWREIQ